MASRKKKTKTAYNTSLAGIFIWSGLDVFVFLFLFYLVLGLVAFFSNRLNQDGLQLMLLFFAVVVLCSYGLPVLSLFKVWRQEHILGIYWKNRTDCDKPQYERDWYLRYDRGGFILCHRAYIRRILGNREQTENGKLERRKVYQVLFEDIKGKKHTLNFSDADARQDFRRWYKKQEKMQEDD